MEAKKVLIDYDLLKRVNEYLKLVPASEQDASIIESILKKPKKPPLYILKCKTKMSQREMEEACKAVKESLESESLSTLVLDKDLDLQVVDTEAEKICSTELEQLFWLAARDIVFFSSYDEDLKSWNRGWHACVNCNNTFGYATADAESLAPGREHEVRYMFDKYGWSGVTAWCAKERSEEPLSELQNEKYKEAKAELDTKEKNNDPK